MIGAAPAACRVSPDAPGEPREGAFDVLAARGALYTVDLLGMAVFRGLHDPAVLQFPLGLDPPAIFWYNALHLAASLAVGLIVTGLLAQAERRPAWARLVLAAIVAGFGVTVVAITVLTAPIRPLLPWWSIVVANALATLVGAWYLVRRHPGLPHRLLTPAR